MAALLSEKKNELALLKRQAMDTERHILEIKENYDILCVEADEKEVAIAEVEVRKTVERAHYAQFA